MIVSPYSYAIMFLPNSPRPPRGIMRNVFSVLVEKAGVKMISWDDNSLDNDSSYKIDLLNWQANRVVEAQASNKNTRMGKPSAVLTNLEDLPVAIRTSHTK